MAVTFNYNQKKLSLVDVLSHLEPDEYSRDEIPVLTFRPCHSLPKKRVLISLLPSFDDNGNLVVHISHRVILHHLTDVHQAYKPYVEKQLLYLFVVAVTDGTDSQGTQHFHQFIIHPKLNETLVHSGMLCCGSIMLMKRYVMRRKHLPDMLQVYYEICDAEVLKCNKDNRPIHWCYNLETTEMLITKLSAKREYFKSEIPLNFWTDAIPKYPSVYVKPYGATSSLSEALLNGLCGQNNLSRINSLWRTDKHSLPVIVRVFSKSKSSYYIPVTQPKNFPVKTTLIVYDKTGCCSVVIWDNAVTKEVMDQIYEGSIIRLDGFLVRTEMNTQIWQKKVLPASSSRYPIELHIQDETRFQRCHLALINPTVTEKYERTYLPHLKLAFVDLLEVSKFEQDDMIHVGGVVVGISRFYRSQRRKGVGIGKVYAFRWVEIWEPSTNFRVSVEVFLNSQLKDHEELKIGMIVAFTFLRVCYKKYTAQEPRMFLSTSQNTQMYLSNVESISETKCDNLPCKVRNKLLCLSGVVPDDFTKSCWIGGAHPFATNYFSSKEIQELSSNCDHGNVNGEELSEVLMGLRLWESKTITFYGEIVEVICCKTGVVGCDALRQRNGRLHPRKSVCIAKSQNWDDIKNAVDVYGTKAPFCHTFPVKYDARFCHHLHESLRFPLTNFHEIGVRNERLKAEKSYVEGLHCSIVYKEYYLVTLLSKDQKVAIICLFFPQTKTYEPLPFMEVLLKENCCRCSPLDSPVIPQVMHGNSDTATYVNSAKHVVGEKVLAVIQVHQSGPNEYEFLFSSGIKIDAIN